MTNLHFQSADRLLGSHLYVSRIFIFNTYFPQVPRYDHYRFSSYMPACMRVYVCKPHVCARVYLGTHLHVCLCTCVRAGTHVNSQSTHVSVIVVCIHTHLCTGAHMQARTMRLSVRACICTDTGLGERQFSTALVAPLCLHPEIWLCLILVYQEASLGPFLVGLRLSGAGT